VTLKKNVFKYSHLFKDLKECDNGIVSLGFDKNIVAYAASKVKMLASAKLRLP
jgi:hypothetical protein